MEGATQIFYSNLFRRLSGPSGRSGVITTIPSQTTFWSQRAPRCHYNDLVPDNLPVPASVPASAQVSLQRFRPRRLSGPSGRPDIITTISSPTTFWPQRPPRCHYNYPVPDDFPVAAAAPSVITPILSHTTFRCQRPPRCDYTDLIPYDFPVVLRLSGPRDRLTVITTIWSQRMPTGHSGGSNCSGSGQAMTQ